MAWGESGEWRGRGYGDVSAYSSLVFQNLRLSFREPWVANSRKAGKTGERGTKTRRTRADARVGWGEGGGERDDVVARDEREKRA